MATRRGGTEVRGGFYWRPAEWQIVALPGDQGVLPGTAREVFHRIPTVAMLLLAPIMGGLFVMFLPLIGFAMVLQFAARTTGAAARNAALALGATLAPSWRPGEAYLTGKGGAGGTKARGGTKEAGAQPDTRLDDLEKEIDERRRVR
jgi:hypothetical protein